MRVVPLPLLSLNLVVDSRDLRIFVLFQHGLKNWHDPILEGAVIVVWDQQVADPVDVLFSKILVIFIEAGTVSSSKDFDDVLFNGTSCSNDSVDMIVLYDKAERGAKSGGDQIASKTEQNKVISHLMH